MSIKRQKLKLIYIIGLISILLLTACQPTPEKEIVIGKGKEQIDSMLEQAQETPQKMDSAAQETQQLLSYTVPERLNYSLESELVDAKIIVDIDAKLIIPEYAVPIVSVKPRNINFVQVNALTSLLSESRPIYHKDFADKIMTKTKLQGKIDYYMWEISRCTAEMKKQKTNYEKYIRDAYKEMQSAPDTYADITTEKLSEYIEELKQQGIADGGEILDEDDGTVAILDMMGEVSLTSDNYNKRNYSLVIGEEYRPDTIIICADNTNKEQGIIYRAARDIGAPFIHEIDDMSIMNGFKMSVDDAIKIAKPFVDSVDSDLVLTDVGAATATDYSTEERLILPYGYFLVYSRQFNGVDANFASDNRGWYLRPDMPIQEYNEHYSQESLSIIVSQDGIYSLEYYCPMEQVEILTADVNILPFDEIQKIFDEKIVLMGFGSTYLKITRIKLGMMRIAQPDNPDEYLLIPVWDFYGGAKGSSEKSIDDELKSKVKCFYGRSFMTINAIDGSIINRSLGY